MNQSFTKEFLEEFKGINLPSELSQRFELLECLSQNECGEAYLALETGSEKLFVLKCYKKSLSLNIGHEAELLRGLEHSGLPKYENEIEDDETLFVVRDYIEGEDLAKYFGREGADEKKAIEIAIKLCDILQYLHSQPVPIIHRDIKPTNIIINSLDHTVMLIDFGISRKYSETAKSDTVFALSEGYAPPEQYGCQQTDCRTDIYALGKVIQYMLTGTDKRNVMVKNKDLSKIVAKCTEFSPDRRFQSASAVKRSLVQYQNRIKKKIQYGALGLMAVIALFTAGFVVGRYTEVLYFEKKDSFALLDVGFTEPLIKDAVRTMLGKEEDQPLLEEELKYVTELYIAGNKICTSRDEYETTRHEYAIYNLPRATIETLEDLRKLENLREVFISYQTLFDVSGLTENKLLTEVSLHHCNILDASPFKELPKLERLELFDSKLTDFSHFESIKSLRYLGIGNMPLKSIYELGDVAHLDFLNLHMADIENLDGVEDMTGLVAIKLNDTAITDFSALNTLPNFEKLYISADMEQYLSTLSRDDVEITAE